MLESTKRGLTRRCPACGQPPGKACIKNGAIIHAARRNLFYIDSGLPKRKPYARLQMPNVPEEQAQTVQSNVVRLQTSASKSQRSRSAKPIGANGKRRTPNSGKGA